MAKINNSALSLQAQLDSFLFPETPMDSIGEICSKLPLNCVPAGAVASHRGAAAAIYAERSDHGKGNVGSSIRGHGHDTIGSVLTPVKRDTPETYVCDHRQHMCWIITIFIPMSVACHEREEAPPRQKSVCMYVCTYVCR